MRGVCEPAGRGQVSRTSGVQAPQDFFGGNPNRTLALKFIQPPVQLFALRFRQRDRARSGRKAVPEFFEELQLLGLPERSDIDHGVVSETRE